MPRERRLMRETTAVVRDQERERDVAKTQPLSPLQLHSGHPRVIGESAVEAAKVEEDELVILAYDFSVSARDGAVVDDDGAGTIAAHRQVRSVHEEDLPGRLSAGADQPRTQRSRRLRSGPLLGHQLRGLSMASIGGGRFRGRR